MLYFLYIVSRDLLSDYRVLEWRQSLLTFVSGSHLDYETNQMNGLLQCHFCPRAWFISENTGGFQRNLLYGSEWKISYGRNMILVLSVLCFMAASLHGTEIELYVFSKKCYLARECYIAESVHTIEVYHAFYKNSFLYTVLLCLFTYVTKCKAMTLVWRLFYNMLCDQLYNVIVITGTNKHKEE